MTAAPKATSTSVAAPVATPAAPVEKTVPAKAAAPKAAAVRAKVAKSPKAPAAKAKAVVAKPKPVAAVAAEKPAKAKKPKLVRDSFTIPKAEYTVLDELKLRAIALAQPAKKSELLRAGIKALAAMSDAALRVALQAVPTIKTGRPAAEAASPAPAKPAAKKAVKKVAKKA
nr:hypothetical protein [uncultured Albidiferax sp.]